MKIAILVFKLNIMENLNNFFKPFEDNKIKLASFFGLECSFNNSEYKLSDVIFTSNLKEIEKFCEKLNQNNQKLHYRVRDLIFTLND